jgi:hypothetical protein
MITASRAAGGVRPQGAHRQRIPLEALRRGRDRGLPLERLLPGHRLVQDDGQAVLVGLAVDGLAADLLGGDVGGGAEDHAGLREVVDLVGLGDPEVGDLHGAVAPDEDVRGLHVAVDQAPAVGVVERARDLLADRGDLADVELARCRG